MLSPFCESFKQKHMECRKLCPNLNDNIKYVTHIKNVQLYIKLGMLNTKIHSVATFKQSAWMKPFVEYNTKWRQAACNDFEKDLYKLMNNACFGKTMENVRDRKDIKLVSNARKFFKLIVIQHLESFKIVNEYTVLVNRLRTSALLNNPIYAGFCILELWKVLMYKFYYNVSVDKYGDDCCLLTRIRYVIV